MAFFSELKTSMTYNKAARRLSKVSPAVRLAWFDSTFWAVQGFRDEYDRTKNRAALEEARTGVLGLLAAVDSLLDTEQ